MTNDMFLKFSKFGSGFSHFTYGNDVLFVKTLYNEILKFTKYHKNIKISHKIYKYF
jgi:hypothetical protein